MVICLVVRPTTPSRLPSLSCQPTQCPGRTARYGGVHGGVKPSNAILNTPSIAQLLRCSPNVAARGEVCVLLVGRHFKIAKPQPCLREGSAVTSLELLTGVRAESEVQETKLSLLEIINTHPLNLVVNRTTPQDSRAPFQRWRSGE